MGFGLNGPVRRTTNGSIGPAGKAMRLYHINVINGAAAVPIMLYNATAAATATENNLYFQDPGLAGGKSISFEGGLRFPNGIYCNIASATAAVATVAREF